MFSFVIIVGRNGQVKTMHFIAPRAVASAVVFKSLEGCDVIISFFFPYLNSGLNGFNFQLSCESMDDVDDDDGSVLNKLRTWRNCLV